MSARAADAVLFDAPTAPLPDVSFFDEEAAEAIAVWRADPVQFVRDQFGVEPDDWQKDALLAIRDNPRTAMKASKGPGKSTVLAWAAWWFLVCFEFPKIVCCSITEDNLRDGLWSEMAKWQARSETLTEAFQWNVERIFLKEAPEQWWMSARTWPKSGNKQEQANTLAGVHADNVLFLIDEAGGVPDAVAAAAEGGLANASKEEGRTAKLVIAGNPTHLEGPLYRASTVEAALWALIEISGDPDDPKRAPRVSVDWAREQIEKYGRDHAFVLVNVFGKFPPSSANQLLGPNEVSDSMKRDPQRATYFEEARILGVDVARHGDDRTVIVLRQGCIVFRPKELRATDLAGQGLMFVVGAVSTAIDKHKPDATFIDAGTFGIGVVDRLLQLGYRVFGVDFGSKPVTHMKYANRRSEMWFRMAEWVKDPVSPGALPDMPELKAELTAPTYSYDKHDKIILEPKKDIKERLGISPDIADAIALTFAQPVASSATRAQQEILRPTANPLDVDPFKGR